MKCIYLGVDYVNIDDHTWCSKMYILADKCFQLNFIQGNIKVIRSEVVELFAQIVWTCSDFPSFKTKQMGGKKYHVLSCCVGFHLKVSLE